MTGAYLFLPTSDLDKCGNVHARKFQADDGWEGGVEGPGEEPRRDASHSVREAAAAVGEDGVLPYATG